MKLTLWSRLQTQRPILTKHPISPTYIPLTGMVDYSFDLPANASAIGG